ncbi:citrate synthase, putative, partial [Perkinsus marinus ATCC 50983]
QDVIGEITVGNVLGGERGMKTMLTDTSDLDSLAGIRYRNMTLREVNAALPKSVGSTIGLSEGLFWLLLT